MSKYISVPSDRVSVTGGFWRTRQDVNRNVTAKAVYDRFTSSHRFEALACRKEGREFEPHIFWDSDVAKWIEGAAYLLSEKRDAAMEKLCDDAISDIIANQADDGYFNSYYLTISPEARFTKRDDHELYCAGHLIEAAVAYAAATGKEEFLQAMRRYADLIYKIFYVERSAAFATSGHPEIELALFRLADALGDEKYAELALYFLNERGNNDKDDRDIIWGNKYYQSDRPLKEVTEAEGHAVRAGYIFSAMADAARRFDDAEYAAACERVFENITKRRMYITGGIGSTNNGEAFTIDYDLPNDTGYAETCAAISLAYFARRMLLLKTDRRYADVVERVMYNGALCGVSLGGDKFFYSNTFEIDTRVCAEGIRPYYPALERVEEFWCSCCPPNILRFIASVTEGFYSYKDDVLFIHQFAESEAKVRGATVTQKTLYPCDGEISLSVRGDFKTAAIRIPGWCESFTLNVPYTLLDGYAYVDIPSDGEIRINFDMPVRLVEANSAVSCDVGKAAVTRGPLVYCLEGKDNGGALYSLFLKEGSEFTLTDSDEFGVPVLTTEGLRRLTTDELYSSLNYRFEPSKLTFIPYFAYANRGADEMTVWVRTLPSRF